MPAEQANLDKIKARIEELKLKRATVPNFGMPRPTSKKLKSKEENSDINMEEFKEWRKKRKQEEKGGE